MPPARPTPDPHAADPAVARLAAARADRTRPAPAQTLSRLFLAHAPEVRRVRRQLAGIAGAWAEVVPPEIAGRVRLEGVNAGVLSVRAEDAAVRFQLDRFLRGGGEARLLHRLPTAVRRIRIGLEGEDGTTVAPLNSGRTRRARPTGG